MDANKYTLRSFLREYFRLLKKTLENDCCTDVEMLISCISLLPGGAVIWRTALLRFSGGKVRTQTEALFKR